MWVFVQNAFVLPPMFVQNDEQKSVDFALATRYNYKRRKPKNPTQKPSVYLYPNKNKGAQKRMKGKTMDIRTLVSLINVYLDGAQAEVERLEKEHETLQGQVVQKACNENLQNYFNGNADALRTVLHMIDVLDR